VSSAALAISRAERTPVPLDRPGRQSLAAEALRRWTTAEGDPDFEACARGLFGY